MHYLDLDYSKQQYLIALYSSIIDQIETGLSHGNIVRYLIQDGSNVTQAENLYQYIFANKSVVCELIIKMKENANKIRLEHETNIARQIIKLPNDYLESQKHMEEFKEISMHAGIHILKHLISSFFH